jgi:glycosyltransferase involved in cell wall biosynthesis
VVFFAKPEMPRRCFELGVMALEKFHVLQPEVEIVLFGSKHVENRALPFPATIKSVLPTLDDLAQLYSNADVGIVFSTTNPSLVPYEMMACGLPVMDLGRPGNEVNYGGRTDIAFLADPAPEIMARQLSALLNDKDDLAARSKRGLEFVSTFPSEEEMARRVEQLILKRVGAGSRNWQVSSVGR